MAPRGMRVHGDLPSIMWMTEKPPLVPHPLMPDLKVLEIADQLLDNYSCERQIQWELPHRKLVVVVSEVHHPNMGGGKWIRTGYSWCYIEFHVSPWDVVKATTMLLSSACNHCTPGTVEYYGDDETAKVDPVYTAFGPSFFRKSG